LLTNAGLTYEAMASRVNEAALKQDFLDAGRSAGDIAIALAQAKALAISLSHPRALVIGADQTLELDGRLFDKPETETAAAAQLRALNGRTHLLHTAVAVARSDGIVWTHLATPRLTLRKFSEAALDRYVAACGAQILGCIGGYQLEGLGVQLFDAIEGDYFAILGLPLLPLLAFLRTAGLADL
jgi:septum formation protein